MSVRLIAVTRVVDPDPDRQPYTSEQLVAYCARVSNPQNQDNPDTGRLLKYMLKKQHWSPFEMVNVVMEISTTRDIARQILRHRSFSFQEFSQRYAEVDSSKIIVREARLQDPKNRQNSIETNNAVLQEAWEQYQHNVTNAAVAAYRWALNNGIAKEQARAVLPEGMTPSCMYMNGTLRSWLHYCLLRMDRMVDPNTGEPITGTQKEHREIATQCWEILKVEFPFLKELE